MDAQDWHRQATQPPVTWPDPVGFDRLDRMPSGEARAYTESLTDALMGALVSADEGAAAAQRLEQVVRTNRMRPPGAMQMAALSAPFTAGKSTLIKLWALGVYRALVANQLATNRPTWSPEPGVSADLRPVVYVTLRASSTVKDVNAQLLLFLGYPPEGLARTTTTRVLHALKMHGVRLVIIDDAHMLRATNALGRQVLDYVKFLNTELGEQNGTIVLVGAHLESTAILDDPQIRGRLTVVKLVPYGIQTTEQRRGWQRFLKSAEAPVLPYLPGAEPGLFSRVLPQHLWRRTQGFVGDTTKLIAGATLQAIDARRNQITAADLDVIPLSERSVDAQVDLAEGAATSKRQRRAG